jgi:hypothetical protein
MFGWCKKCFKRERDIKEIFSQKVGPANLAFARPQILEIFPSRGPVERNSMNSRQEVKSLAAVKATGREKRVMATLWAEICQAFFLIDPAMVWIQSGH